ncbi:MAG: four helix bundle protein [Bacteroidales bacterium]|nr:four helix bundle protein [Bacteroidales bacterium]
MKDSKSLLNEKSMDFAVRCVNLYKYLAQEKNEYVMSKQVYRSGTSVGANIRESRNAQSTADFINKLNIALKEADETQFWIELLFRTQFINETEYTSINDDINEIISILTASIKTNKKKISNNPS